MRKLSKLAKMAKPVKKVVKDKAGKFIRINKAQARMLNIPTPEDAIGKSDFDFFENEFAKKAAGLAK